jgi:ribosomal protein S27E
MNDPNSQNERFRCPDCEVAFSIQWSAMKHVVLCPFCAQDLPPTGRILSDVAIASVYQRLLARLRKVFSSTNEVSKEVSDGHA